MGGGILNNKAFTLIELLAIIVILAIIAVITVPIILNIIDNSKKGAATDSAYGYKDSVQQYYLSETVGSTTNEVLTIDTIKTVSQLESDGLTVSGDKPSDGWVQLNKGQVVDYSLKFGDYVVSFDATINAPVATKNGELKVQPSDTSSIRYGFKTYDEGETEIIIGTSGYTATGKNAYLKYALTNGEVTEDTVPEACIYSDTYGGELCLRNNDYDGETGSKQKIINYFGYDAITWIPDTKIASKFYNDSNHTIACVIGESDIYCEDSGVIATAYSSGYVTTYENITYATCEVNLDGSSSCYES